MYVGAGSPCGRGADRLVEASVRIPVVACGICQWCEELNLVQYARADWKPEFRTSLLPRI